jgi:hypothetical protein
MLYNSLVPTSGSRGSSVGLVTRLEYGRPRSRWDARDGQEIYRFSPDSGSQQPPIQWVAAEHSRGIKRPGSESEPLTFI